MLSQTNHPEIQLLNYIVFTSFSPLAFDQLSIIKDHLVFGIINEFSQEKWDIQMTLEGIID